MNFKPELVEKILAGEKTQTRRLCSDNPRSPWYVGGCSLRPNRAYAVCPGRGKPGVAHVVVERVWRHAIGFMEDDAARAEGFSGAEEFFDYWERLHGAKPAPETMVWAVEFFLIPEDDELLWEGAAA